MNWSETVYNHMQLWQNERYEFEGDWVPFLDAKGGTYDNQFIQASMYNWQVRNWVETFGRENVHVALMEEVGQDTWLPNIFKFLDVVYRGEKMPHKFKGGRDNGHLTLAKHREIYPDEIATLFPMFRREAEKLSSYLSEDLLYHWDLGES